MSSKRLLRAVALLVWLCGLGGDFKGLAATPVRMTEMYSENSSQITFRVILRAGSVNDVKGKEGINALTAAMIAAGGTRQLQYKDVVARLYPWAAGIAVQPDREITTFIGQVHRDHLEEFYKVFRDLLLSPRFDPEDFTRNKDLALSFLEKNLRGTDDEDLGKEALGASLFAGHPYGTPGASVQGLRSTTLDDIRQYYRKNYTTGNLWIGIAGGYPKTLVDRMKADFSKLPDSPFSPLPLPPVQEIKGLEILFVDKPARATAVSMGRPLNLTRKDRDFYALLVANSYFGEHRTFSGVLMNRLRGERGLNYGDYSYIERFTGGVTSGSQFPNVNTPLRQQYFSIWLRPLPPEKAHFAIRAAMYELQKFVDKGLTEAQFQQTRKFLIHYSKLWAQTLDRRLGYRMDSEFYGTDDYIGRIERELKTLTVDEVNRAIRKYISPANLKVAIVAGDAKQLGAAILSNAPSPITYSSPASERILEEDKTISTLPLAINRAKTGIIPVSRLFETAAPMELSH